MGAVALDIYGNLACATSTGGITRQIAGRVSDSCLVGSGGFADNEIGELLQEEGRRELNWEKK